VIATTLNEIRKHRPCEKGWKDLLKHLGEKQADDEPLPFLTILESNGIDDCLWALRCRPDLENLWRHFAVDCAERVVHLMEDQRSRDALIVARKHALGEATNAELVAASAAAWAWQSERLTHLLKDEKWTPVEKESEPTA